MDDQIAEEILWSLIDKTRHKTWWLIREFSTELKSGPEVLKECSSWVHQLLDMVRSGLAVVPDRLPVSEIGNDVMNQLAKELGDFAALADDLLGVKRRRIVITKESNIAIAAVVKAARGLNMDLAKELVRLESILPGDTVARLRSMRNVFNPDDDLGS